MNLHDSARIAHLVYIVPAEEAAVKAGTDPLPIRILRALLRPHSHSGPDGYCARRHFPLKATKNDCINSESYI